MRSSGERRSLSWNTRLVDCGPGMMGTFCITVSVALSDKPQKPSKASRDEHVAMVIYIREIWIKKYLYTRGWCCFTGLYTSLN